jgi:hypothetical protein
MNIFEVLWSNGKFVYYFENQIKQLLHVGWSRIVKDFNGEEFIGLVIDCPKGKIPFYQI